MNEHELHIIREAAEYFESRGSDVFAEKLKDIYRKYSKNKLQREIEDLLNNRFKRN